MSLHMVSQKAVSCRVNLKREGKKKKVLEMPKCTEVKQCLGNCPAKDAFCRERNLMQGPCTAALCCCLAVMKLRETKICFFD